jgi:hypothetical protein
MIFCALGRALNIFPLTWIANRCRKSGVNKIPPKMQMVLWFAGLRGAIAFALSENMPGPNRDTYTTCTLTICMFTTIVCGGFTEKMLKRYGMKQGGNNYGEIGDDEEYLSIVDSPTARRMSSQVYKGFKGAWKELDNQYLKKLFGDAASQRVQRADGPAEYSDEHGDYEVSNNVWIIAPLPGYMYMHMAFFCRFVIHVPTCISKSQRFLPLLKFLCHNNSWAIKRRIHLIARTRKMTLKASETMVGKVEAVTAEEVETP